MYVYTPAGVAEKDYADWCTAVRKTANSVAPFDLKEPVGIDEAIMTLSGEHPLLAWDTVDADWRLPEDARLQFVQRVAKGQKNMDMLVARFVPQHYILQGDEHVKLMDVYKQVPTNEKEVELVFWDAEDGKWAFANAKDADAKFRRSVQDCIEAALMSDKNPAIDYKPCDLPVFLHQCTWLQAPATQAIESFLDIPFYNNLNGDTTRGYWKYSDGAVECRNDHIVRRADRTLPLTLTCGYPYPGEAVQALKDA